MRPRPLATAAAAALVVGAVAGPALAGTPATGATAAPALGSARSTLTLLTLLAGSHNVAVGGLTLSTDSLTSSPLSTVTVVPVKADGKSYGTQTVTPSNSPSSVGAFPAPSALAGLFAVNSPIVSVSASKTSAHAGTTSLGSVSLLGLPIGLDGTIDSGSAVGAPAGALGSKTVSIKNVRLPDIAALLAAEGLDLSKLPANTLTSLVNRLGLVDGAISAAQAALNAATVPIQSQIDAADAQVTSATSAANAASSNVTTGTAALASANSALSSATSKAAASAAALTAANAALSTATSALNAKLGAIPVPTLATLPSGANTIAGYALLTPSQRQTVENAVPGTGASFATYTSDVTTQAAAATKQANDAAALATATTNQASAATALATAQTAFTAAKAALTTATSALSTVLAQLAPQVAGVVSAVIAKLSATPLVSIDSLVVTTKAAVTSAAKGGQTAQVIGGKISGLKVLGTDVLAAALGTSSVNALDLAGSTLSKVQTQIASVTSTLSNVLSSVPSLPTLAIPAPQIDLLTKSTAVAVSGGFGTASATVQALKITLPSITIPAAVALPGAPALPAISGLPAIPVRPSNAVTDLVSKQISMGIGSVSEQAKFKPAVVGAPGTTGTQTLPKTGVETGFGLVAIMLIGGGLIVRRRVTGTG